MQVCKCVIIGDNREDNDRVGADISEYPYLNKQITQTSLEQAPAATGSAHIIILNVSFLSEKEVILLKEVFPVHASVIVLSERVSDALTCFDSGIPVDFVLKPFASERLAVALGRAISRLTQNSLYFNSDFLFFKVNRSYRRFSLDEIFYFEGYGRYSKIYMENEILAINESLNKVEGLLPAAHFMKVHKSFIINRNKIVSFNTSQFEFSIGSVPIGAQLKMGIDDILEVVKDNSVTE